MDQSTEQFEVISEAEVIAHDLDCVATIEDYEEFWVKDGYEARRAATKALERRILKKAIKDALAHGEGRKFFVWSSPATASVEPGAAVGKIWRGGKVFK